MSTDTETNNDAVRQTPVYELRVYHVYEGKLDQLVDRFRNHTIRLFKKHGMKDLAFWAPNETPLKGKQLIYVLEHASREAAAESWKNLIADPEWIEVKAQSEANGKLAEAIDSTFMDKLNLSALSPGQELRELHVCAGPSLGSN